MACLCSVTIAVINDSEHDYIIYILIRRLDQAKTDFSCLTTVSLSTTVSAQQLEILDFLKSTWQVSVPSPYL
jgi:hypothetical protein